MANVGDNPKVAKDAAEAIFKALPKTRQAEYLGELNEVLIYIDRHSKAKKKP